ncbi:MAG: cation:proton antiporter [Gemmatimonadota bacterium]
MTALTVLLLAASVGYGGARLAGIPAIPVLILAGLAASSLVPLDTEFLSDVLTLGVAILVFVAGIELSPGRLRSWGQTALQVGSIQFVVLGALGLGVALALGFAPETAAYLALALTASSTLVVVQLLRERGLLYEPMGRLVTGVLLLQDLLIILFIPIVVRIPDGGVAIAQGVAASLGMMALAGALLRWVVPRILERFAFDEETLLLITLSTLVVFIGIADFVGLPLVSGAFLAGVVLSGFPSSALVRGQVSSLGDFFHAIFFAALGAAIPLPTAIELGQALVFFLLVVLVTPPLVALVAERAGFSARPALASGLLLSQTSEFSLVVALQGLVMGHLAPGVFTIITLVTIATMMVTPFLASDRATWALMKVHPFRDRPKLERSPEGHVLLLGSGRHGQLLMETLLISPEELVVADDDPKRVSWLAEMGIRALRGDISDARLLRELGADRAKVVISTIRRRDDNGPLLQMARDVPVLVRAFNVEDAEWIRLRGGHPVLYSEAAAEDFLEWYDSEWLAETAGNT